MTPREDRADIKDYRPILSLEARDSLKALAAALGYSVSRKGTYFGKPSAPDMLEALAACYRAAPDNTLAALADLLADNGLLPSTPPAE